ncbi:hypothetical protein ACFLZN_02120 [Nanoarchaeota archaeon]
MVSKSLILGIVVAVLVVGVVIYSASDSPPDINAAVVGKCLTNNGAKMYGAYWCGHCNKQKEMFGADWSKVDYVECSTPDGGQAQVCTDAGITGYPTWVFSDGTKKAGAIPLDKLAELAGCI